MIGEKLEHQNGQDKARVMTEPFFHYLGSTEEGPDAVVLVGYTEGPSAGQIDTVPVDHLVIYWKLPLQGTGSVEQVELH
jgi:hypothetical protein